VIPVLYYLIMHYAMKAYGRSGFRWGWMDGCPCCFASGWPPSPQCPLDRRLSGP
jgi:hypothetical protein